MLNFSATRVVLIIILAVMLSLNIYGIYFSVFWYAVTVFIFLAFVGAGSYFIKWNFFLKAQHYGTTSKNEIALTFDDGPDEKNTLKVLKVLDRYNAKATFFCIGDKLSKNRSIAKKIIEMGHSIGNHSYNHQHKFPLINAKRMIEEIEKTNHIIEELVGTKNKMFRPPFGITNPRIARAVSQTSMRVIGWNVRSYDTVGATIQKVVQQVNKQLKPGAIVLLHDNLDNAPQILEAILRYMKEQNLKSVRVEDLLKI